MNRPMELPSTSVPIVAILRGVRPDEVADIAEALLDRGIQTIEVPLNSPDPFTCIERLAAALGDRGLCGAGTVLVPEDVDRTFDAGGRLVVAPNMSPAVIERACDREMAVMPGFASATEAFGALAAGARDLKLFPPTTYGPDHVRALRVVLPPGIRIFAVGGIGPDDMGPWLAAGAAGFGIGSGIYEPGDTPEKVAARADRFADALRVLSADGDPAR